MSYSNVELIRVSLHFTDKPLTVGRLAYRDKQVFFEYDNAFIESKYDISPFMLPKKLGVQAGDVRLFDGLPGVFNDSLPDGWGRLLLDRVIRAHGILPGELTPLDRLTYVGDHGMGAMCYEPDNTDFVQDNSELDLNALAQQARQILEGESSAVINELLALNGSSAGARPKAMIGLDQNKQHILHGVEALPDGYDYWLVKFPNAIEPIDSGAIEFAYYEMAIASGIEMMESCLLPANHGPGFFATKRFDRNKNQRLHTVSACGLLHSDFRTPSLDYLDLLKATYALTKNAKDVVQLYRLAVFNVMSHNRDDHSKNSAFIMNQQGQWHFAPAYDLTFSSGPGGEQSTMVLGKGRQITCEDLLELAIQVQIDKKQAQSIIDQVRQALSQWRSIAKNIGVSKENQELIVKQISLF
ncbi:MAG: type II toxin-antitoxin system HipA family toxin [Coxiellaceae bacterium]|nr:type II toxin-antitoxin system HipA family toxin [Coxiellaceae bacterium]